MRLAIAVVASLVVLNVLVIGGTATGTGYAWPLAHGLIISTGWACLVVVGVWLLRWLTSSRGRFEVTTASLQRRVVAVVAATVVAEFLVIYLLAARWAEAFYYVVLVGAGAALSAWAGARAATPLWLATAILVLLAVTNAGVFVADRGNRWQYGPEVYLFMMWHYAGRMNMLPLDAAAAWAGWSIAAIWATRPNQGMQLTGGEGGSR